MILLEIIQVAIDFLGVYTSHILINTSRYLRKSIEENISIAKIN
jgi:hypothetical protein